MAVFLRQIYLTSSQTTPQPWTCRTFRNFCYTASLHAGHSKWANTKHVKSRNDAAKSKERQVISQELIQASKLYGPNPGSNPKLAAAIASAKRSGMSKATMEFAIAKGQGKTTSGAPLEPLTIEAMFPGSVAVVIECQTDQKGRTLQEVRHIIKEYGGTLTPTTFLFEKKGKIVFEKDPRKITEDDCLESAIDAGAVDVDTDSKGRLIVYTDPAMTKAVGEKLAASLGLKIESLDIIWDPNRDTMVMLSNQDAFHQLEEFLNELREESTVQEIYMNLKNI
ncbi:hypothetical protein LOZ61_002454 [Ophidiomyces ophidiicola]|nr:hypothetical protein LOZ61_002454 [Ophidiomyces ophidiicola]KAI1929539.1 hypothetical protein LOZ60_001560 [Ophidiomyces ophidiicola]KAI2034825.1 hypothetical protein LOZ48_001551 [Ophidiomyces ophidiicola]KAI2035348.1 hypothetical protein LOZ45_000334 [Ophidiomyces ophidiicola]KAI2072070.1 hypothetical protein LOZ40_001476 [Ophidiomyces ophidiicola]